LKPSAITSSTSLQYDSGTSIVIQLGGRYKQYCSNIGRTYYINPSEYQKSIYLLLTQVYLACKVAMKAGQKMSSVYTAAVKLIQSKKPELFSQFTKNCGFSMGLEFRESSALLNEKNNKLFQKGMIFNLCVGFENLTDTKTNKKFSALLADTMIISEGSEAESLTKMPREWKDIAYYIGDVAEEEKNNNNTIMTENLIEIDAGTGRATRGSLNRVEVNEADIKKRSEHQAELARKQRDQALQRLASQNADKSFNSSVADSSLGWVDSYDSVKQFPSAARRERIYVDVSAESLLLPIGDHLVPFHISTVKNVHKQTEQEFTYLRINFTTPDAKAIEKDAEKSKYKYISELTYRTQSNSLDKVFFDIKELRKRVQLRQKEAEAKSSIVVQEDLKVSRPGMPLPTLKDIAIRPLLSRKKTMGTLQAHTNGLRFISVDKLKVDIIYANIKSAFYQPAEESHQVLLHFELVNPILLDKSKTKKTNFLQFYVEVVEVSEDLSTTNRYRDEDGLLEEQEERRRRKRWNERFLNFVKEVEDKINKLSNAELNGFRLEFDIPYRELAFQGVPAKAAVTIMPTVHSLVALEDQPPMVLALNDVQIAVFERIQFGLKNFDLVFVWKDFTKQPLRVDSIPTQYLDPIKHWLNSCDIVFYESGQNILWKNVIKTINEDIEGFWQDGGWSFLGHEGDDGESEEEDEEQGEEEGGEENGQKSKKKKKSAGDESESDFEPSGSGSDSDDSEEYETPSEEESDEESDAEDSQQSSGEDWDELEAKAIREDKDRVAKARARGDSDVEDSQNEERRPKKKARS
jgi:nucleosome binding factor SPN SPT16 subunit